MMTQHQTQTITSASNTTMLDRSSDSCSSSGTNSIMNSQTQTTPALRRRRPSSVMCARGIGTLVTLTVIATFTPQITVSALSLPKAKVRNVLHGVDLHVGAGASPYIPYTTGSSGSAYDTYTTSSFGFDSSLNMAGLQQQDEVSKSEQEFEMHVGRALDTLRSDYPDILTDQPNFSIYDVDLEVVDPSGVTVHGISAYKNAFRFLHGIVKVLYCPTKSDITFRMCYDKARQCIRIHWNAKVVPREIFGGARTTSYVDGISCYEMDRATGMITQHRIEKLLMNQTPVRPKEGVYAALKNKHVQSVPSYIQTADTSSGASISGNSGSTAVAVVGSGSITMEFQPVDPVKALLHSPSSQPSSLFSMEASSSSSDGGGEASPDLDWENRFNSKNVSRKKYGLKPLTQEEFVEVEAAVKLMDTQQRTKQATDKSAAELTNKQSKGKKPNFLESIFGNAMKDTCESNYDCERPEICCDFGFKKMCCSSGQMILDSQKMVPVRVIAEWQPGQLPKDNNY
jgi:hypothetical protein